MMKFIAKNSAHSSIQFGHKEKHTEEKTNTKFLGLQIDNHINCKNHVKEMISKLSVACYAVRSMVHISIINTLKSIYYAYFHSITKRGIIFWGNSSNSGKIFTVQKKTVSLMTGAQARTSHRSPFKHLEILPVPCQYILSLTNFIINNQKIFQTNSSIHNINTRNKHHLHRPNANLSCFQKKYILCWHTNIQQFTTQCDNPQE